MPTAIIGALVSYGVSTAVATFIVNYAISALINKVFAPDVPEQEKQKDQGVDVRVSPNTSNKLPIVYGNMRVRGTIVMAELSSDNKKMGYIVALGQGSINSVGLVRWEDKELTLSGDINTGLRSVTTAVDLDGNNQDFLNGNLRMRAYPNGGECSEMDAFSAVWSSKDRPMTETPYIYIELTYNREEGVTGLGNLSFDVQGKKIRTLTGGVASGSTFSNNPAEVILDYMTDTVSGLSIPDEDIDLDSLQTLKDFCDESVNYTTIAGDTGTAKRYTTNGSMNTNSSTDSNLSDLMVGCQSTLSYTLGQFGVVVNNVKTSKRTLDSNDIIGGISVTDSGFNGLVNDLTLGYRSPSNNYKADQVVLQSPASVKNFNEPLLEQTVQLPFTSNNVEAERVGAIILNQSRQSLTASFTTTVEHLDLSSGDIISITDDTTGWVDKEFRIMSILEENGDILTLNINALEYAAEMYDDISLNEKDVAPNTNLPNLNTVGAAHSMSSTESLYTSATSGGVKSALHLQWSAPSNNLFVDSYEVWTHQPNENWDTSTTYTVGTRVAHSGNRYEALLETTGVAPSLAGDANWHLLASLDDNDFLFEGKSSTESLTIQDTKPGEYAIRLFTVSSFGVKSQVYQVENIVVNGLLVAPKDVLGFSITPQEDMALLEWEQSTDLDVKIGGYVQVRHTSSLTLSSDLVSEWASASILTGGKSGVTTQIVVPLLVGTYLIKFLDSSGKESVTPGSVVNTIEPSGSYNFLHTITEGPTWAGTHDSTEIDSNNLRLDTTADYFLTDESGNFLTTESGDILITDFSLGSLSPVQMEGFYYFSNTLNNDDSSASQKLSSNLVFTAENTEVYIDALDSIDAIVDWDGDIPSASANIQISITKDGTTWSDYSSFTSGTYNFLSAKFRVKININDNSTQVTISEASVSVDVIDITKAVNGLSWDTSGSSASTNYLDVFYVDEFYNNQTLSIFVDPYLGMSFDGLLPGEYFLTSCTEGTAVKGAGDPPYSYEGFRLQLKTVSISGGLLSQPNTSSDSTINRAVSFDYRAIGY